MNLSSTPHQARTGKRLKRLLWIPTCLAALLAATAGLAAQKPPAQSITLTVLDRMDRPVAGALVSPEARAGKPLTPPPWKTDASGNVTISWLPQRVDLVKGARSRDQVFELKSELLLKVSAPGFAQNTVGISAKAQGRVMANPKLAALNQKAELGPVKEVVVLTKTATLLAGRLGPKGDAPKAREKCLAFIRRNRQALKSLGIEFDTPAFELKGNMLRLKVVWRGPTWGGLDRMPMKTRAVLNAGLPLARALGSEVLPLPGVKSADIWVACEDKPGGDQLAVSGVVSVVLGSSAKDLIRLGNGETTPRNFVRENPVVTRRTGG